MKIDKNKFTIKKFSNIYGIVEFEHELDLNTQCTLIYANNGIMKTSFTKGISKIINGEIPEELIFNKKSSYEIVIGKNSYTEENTTEKIKNVICFANDLETQKLTNIDKIAILLFNEDISTEIKKLDDEQNEKSKNLIEKMKKMLKLKNIKKLYNIFSDIYKPKNSLNSIHNLLEQLDLISFEEIYDKKNLDINILCKILNMFKKYPEIKNSDAISEYNKFMQTTKNTTYVDNINFTITELENITNVFVNKANGFFKNKENYIYLSEIGSEGKLFQKIEHAEQLQKIYNEEYQKIYDSNEHKEKIEAISNILNKNIDNKEIIKKVIQDKNNNWIIEEINNDSFPKKYLQTILSVLKNEIKTFLKESNDIRIKVNELFNKAKNHIDTTLFDTILADFKKLISLPFDIKIKDKLNSVIYEEKPQTFYFEYKDIKETKKEKSEDDSKQTLSSGEKKALSFLKFLYKLKILNKENTQEPKIIILDDVVESFDYKNKYSILNYLNDFIYNKEYGEKNKLIILSHNFDFIRTCQHFFSNKTTLFARKTKDNGKLSFKNVSGNDSKYKNLNSDNAIKIFNNWKNILNENNDEFTQKCILIAFIPLLRNIDILFNEDENNLLNEILHYFPTTITDNKFSSEINWKDLNDEYKKNNININQSYLENKIHKDIFNCADEIYKNFNSNNTEIGIYDELKNKIILSIAIRLLLEKKLYSILLKSNSNFPNELKKENRKNWLSFLQQEIRKKELNTKIENIKNIAMLKILSNDIIHINSFMYEPIIDLDYGTIIDLYNEIKNSPIKTKQVKTLIK